MIQRKRILQQSGIFLRQNPGEAHLTLDELRQMATSNNSNTLISKISRYRMLQTLLAQMLTGIR